MPENCNDCPLTPRVDALERANERHGKTHGEIYQRLNALERGESAQAEQYKNIVDKLDALSDSHKELRAEIAQVKSKPGEKWEKIVFEVIKWGVLLILGIAAVKAGLHA